VLDFLFRPLRSALGTAERDVSAPLAAPERELTDAVEAIRRTTDSIEHHVEVIEALATSVGPLTESVNQLTATMRDLVSLLAPMGEAERGVQRAGRFLGFHRHERATESEPGSPETRK
jgi:hypothetical protein